MKFIRFLGHCPPKGDLIISGASEFTKFIYFPGPGPLKAIQRLLEFIKFTKFIKFVKFLASRWEGLVCYACVGQLQDCPAAPALPPKGCPGTI